MLDEKTLENLVTEYQQSDFETDVIYETLWELIQPHVETQLRRIAPLPDGCSEAEAIQTVLADVSISLKRALKSFRWESPVSYFVNSITAKRKRDFIRKAFRMKLEAKIPDDLCDSTLSLDHTLIAQRQKKILREAIETYLRDCPRTGIEDLRIIRYWEQGLSWKEIGCQLGIKENTANKRYSRVLKKLRRIIEDELQVSPHTLFS